MDVYRAMQILDPDHRERYDSLDPVNEACEMGIAELEYTIPKVPHPDGDKNIVACRSCGSGEYLCAEFVCNWDGTLNYHCSQCGNMRSINPNREAD